MIARQRCSIAANATTKRAGRTRAAQRRRKANARRSTSERSQRAAKPARCARERAALEARALDLRREGAGAAAGGPARISAELQRRADAATGRGPRSRLAERDCSRTRSTRCVRASGSARASEARADAGTDRRGDRVRVLSLGKGRRGRGFRRRRARCDWADEDGREEERPAAQPGFGAATPGRTAAAATPQLETAARSSELDVRGKRFCRSRAARRAVDRRRAPGGRVAAPDPRQRYRLLGRGLQQYLRAHPHVSSVRFGNDEEGGSGVTVFELQE